MVSDQLDRHPAIQAETNAEFEIRVLGRFRIIGCSAGKDIHFRSRKALALLASLAIAPERTLTRERAMELLWGSRGEEQARGSLRQILYEIRASSLGTSAALDIGRLYLAFRGNSVRTDIQQIASLAQAGQIEVLASRMSDCPDRLFEGLDGIDPVFDDWLRVEREQQLFTLSHAVIGLCTSEKQRNPTACRTIVSALQRLNPCDETIAGLGLELDHATGDLAALHQRYRWLEASLQRDLDVSPSEGIRDLFRELARVAPVHSARPGDAIASASSHGVKASPMEPPVIAIAEFDLLSNSESERALATILANEIEFALEGLTDVRLLSVGDASQATLRALSGNSISAYVLRSSLLAEGDELHLGWKLSRVRDGLLLWTHRATAPRNLLRATIDGIVARVAGAVLPTLERDFDNHPIDAGEDSGYGIYLQGRARMLSASTIEEMRAAASLFERAIEIAPRLVNAQLSLARLYNTDYEQSLAGHDRSALRRAAFELCSRAVNVNPRSAHARARLGWCYMRRGDLSLARNQFQEALALSPYHADCLDEIGVAFCHMGELDRAMTLLSRAFELNPFPPDDYFCDMAVLHMLRGDHGRAEENFEIAHNGSLHYGAFRLANRSLLGLDGEPAINSLRERFLRTWIGARPPEDDDLIEAIFEYIPLQRAEHREVVTNGLVLSGLRPKRFRASCPKTPCGAP